VKLQDIDSDSQLQVFQPLLHVSTAPGAAMISMPWFPADVSAPSLPDLLRLVTGFCDQTTERSLTTQVACNVCFET
jgi:hypothetical protein